MQAKLSLSEANQCWFVGVSFPGASDEKDQYGALEKEAELSLLRNSAKQHHNIYPR